MRILDSFDLINEKKYILDVNVKKRLKNNYKNKKVR